MNTGVHAKHPGQLRYYKVEWNPPLKQDNGVVLNLAELYHI